VNTWIRTRSTSRRSRRLLRRRISFEQLEARVGAQKGANFRVLKRQLDEDFVDELVDL